MRYGSVCSGIEAASVAWPSNWEPAFFAEIDKFPRAVLRHHYPDVSLHGDFTTIGAEDYGPIDILVGGTPCQSFSIAGLRKGLDAVSGNLALEYIKLAYRKRAPWVCWENVPGVFSSNGAGDFRSLLSGFVGWAVPIPANGWKNSGIITGAPGCYGVAWRVLDAQYFGVPQRRRRVFLIGYFGDWRPASAVLFESESMSRNHPPCRKKKKEIAGTITAGLARRRGSGQNPDTLIPDVAGTLGGASQTGGFRTTDLDNNGALVVNFEHGLAPNGSMELHDTVPPLGAAETNNHTLMVPDIQEITAPLDASYGRLQRVSHQDANHDHSLLVLSHGQTTAELTDNTSPTLNCNHDGAPIAFLANATADQAMAAAVDLAPTVMQGNRAQPAIAFKPSHYTRGKDGAPSEIVPPLTAEADKGDQEPIIFQPRYARNGFAAPDTIAAPLTAGARKDDTAQCVVFDPAQITNPDNRSNPAPGDPCHTLAAGAHAPAVADAMEVRRLTPIECERLQGYLDNYTAIPWRGKPADKCPDGPRYKALGESMAVPVMCWLSERIQMVQDIMDSFGKTGGSGG